MSFWWVLFARLPAGKHGVFGSAGSARPGRRPQAVNMTGENANYGQVRREAVAKGLITDAEIDAVLRQLWQGEGAVNGL